MDDRTKDLLRRLDTQQLGELLDEIAKVAVEETCLVDKGDNVCSVGSKLAKLGINLLEIVGCCCSLSVVHPEWNQPVIYVTPEGINEFE
jgi:hypothetical protein